MHNNAWGSCKIYFVSIYIPHLYTLRQSSVPTASKKKFLKHFPIKNSNNTTRSSVIFHHWFIGSINNLFFFSFCICQQQKKVCEQRRENKSTPLFFSFISPSKQKQMQIFTLSIYYSLLTLN